MPPPYKHIIWDWNGTLLDDAWLCVEVLNDLLARRGREPISADLYRRHFDFPVVRFYEFLGFDTKVDAFETVSREFIGGYEARWLAECRLHPETATVLDRLADAGLTHSVLSAAKQETLECGVRHFGIEGRFVGLAGVDNIHAEGKIARGRHWVEQLRHPGGEVVVVGDTLHDFEVARAIGADCLLLAHGHHAPERLVRTGAPVLPSLAELAARLAGD